MLYFNIIQCYKIDIKELSWREQLKLIWFCISLLRELIINNIQIFLQQNNMPKKMILLLLMVSFALNFEIDKQSAIQNLQGEEHCYWVVQPCPMRGGESRPVCSMYPNPNDPSIWDVCTMESNSLWGGSFNVDNQIPRISAITGVQTAWNEHCANFQIHGTSFHVHCGCGGSCNVHGWWRVHVKY